MGVDEDAAQALHPEPLDETHATHVGGQVVDFRRSFDSPDAVVLLAQVHAQTGDARHPLVPVGKWFLVNRPNAGEPFVMEIAGQRPADEPTGSGNHEQVILVHGRTVRGTLQHIHFGSPSEISCYLATLLAAVSMSRKKA